MTNVKTTRLKRGLTQRQLAEKSGVAQQTISQLERGHFAPRTSQAAALAKALEVRPEELFPELS